MQSFWTSLSALQASTQWLDRIGDNVANVDTPGFAAESQSFADTLTQVLSAQATAPAVAPRYTPPGWWGGTGVRTAAAELHFDGMPLVQTGQPSDLALTGDASGNAFFAVRSEDGRVLYTRAGDFHWVMAADGRLMLATAAGLPVLATDGQPVTVDAGTGGDVHIGPDGTVYVKTRGGEIASGQRIAIVVVAEPDQHLQAVDGTLYALQPGGVAQVVNMNGRQAGAAGAGAARAGAGGTAGTAGPGGANAIGNAGPVIVQGALNQSAVNLTEQMVQLVTAQRLFDLNAEVLQLSNRMMQTANNIRA
ncbi:flagellar basal body rod protein FlgG [Alicyclobacillus cellulosilyticus]|uniref:Flagellar basal body rod protein FlgG n=1 Tax=Alicyclobacillus cellulosilyticus TaxID=1003997 RepID=A0A917NND5_9BACL|nr:flagellar hook-basal body protein [Alicyclobacillus cellulosilyticus]GGJ13684.1 flagellar basal body rod protein FlgG [Alicyclobacillus cellulosilyticus]